MAPRRPQTAHVADLLHQGQRRQFIATSSTDLSKQIKAAVPALPSALVDQLAHLVIERRARVELPDLVTLRHVSTLIATTPAAPTSSPAEATRRPAQGDDQAQDTALAPAMPAAVQQGTAAPVSSEDEPPQ